MKKLYFILCVICLLLFSCSKSKKEVENVSNKTVTEVENVSNETVAEVEIKEIYSGTCTVTYLSLSYYPEPNLSVPLTLQLENGKYACKGIPHDQADISGTYTTNNDKIIFEIDVWKTDYKNKDGSIMCADFVTFLIPQGECSYTIEGDKLILSKVYDDIALCEWNLVKN